jgi:hypothetical protein
MLRPSRARIFGGLAAGLCAFAVPLGAGAASYIGPLQIMDGTQLPDAGSHIELTRITLLRFVPLFDPQDRGNVENADVECVKFINHDPRTASRVVVRFSYQDAAGNEVGSDTLDERAIFPPGPTFGTVAPNTPSAPGQKIGNGCRSVFGFGYRSDGRLHIDYDRWRVAIVASVREVDYVNGTSWTDPGLAPVSQGR